ncbi:MAG TPA: hypothetical protein VGQ57_13020 [Polyangiaceae bacterium]|nr:hypothetical protein [Polyangiaceae bacterium]
MIALRSSLQACLFVVCSMSVACGGSPSHGDDDDDSDHGGQGGSSGSGGTSGKGSGGTSGSAGESGSGGTSNVVTDTCTTTCQDDGFESGTASGNSCTCASPTDAACVQAMSAFCTCLAAKEPPPCTSQDQFNDYVECHTNRAGLRSKLLCVGGYVSGSSIDCDAALGCF